MDGDANFQNVCRICTNNTNGISIYSKEGREISLEEKIKKFLSIQVNEKDKLPKMVCSLCLNKLDHINKFAIMAIDSQTKLINCLNTEGPSLSLTSDRPTNKSDSELDNDETSCDSSYNQEIKSSLLHAILTQGHVTSTNDDVTEMEVTVDPMLFFEEDDDVEAVTDKAENNAIDFKKCSSDEEYQRKEEGLQILELKPYQCTLCPRGFNSDLGLKSHFWNHIPSKKILSDLNRRLPSPLALSASLRHRRLYNAQCLCQECGRVYPSRSTLRAHQITHSTLRPHKCSLCEKTFKRNQDLKFHINQHTGERPYRCPYCPKAFASSGNCFSHRKRMHSKQLAKEKKSIGVNGEKIYRNHKNKQKS